MPNGLLIMGCGHIRVCLGGSYVLALYAESDLNIFNVSAPAHILGFTCVPGIHYILHL